MSRNELLNNLLNMNSSVCTITDELNKIGWDSNEDLVTLTRQHILNVLRNYQEGKIDEAEVEDWANAVEGREDIGREKSYEELINKILHELANPYLTEKLTKERAKVLIVKVI